MACFMSNGSRRQDKHTWARCGVASLVEADAYSMFLTKLGIVWSERKALHGTLHMERFAVKPLTLSVN